MCDRLREGGTKQSWGHGVHTKIYARAVREACSGASDLRHELREGPRIAVRGDSCILFGRKAGDGEGCETMWLDGKLGTHMACVCAIGGGSALLC